MASQDIFIARQPIFNREMRVYAYELLFRNGSGQNLANVMDGDAASVQVILNSIGEFGLDNLVGEAKAFINFTEGLLNRQVRPILPKRRIVVEVLEDVKVTPALVRHLKELRANGFTIALDDYIFDPATQPLEEVADIIKVDIMDAGPQKMLEHTQRLKDRGIKLLAEKVETEQQYLFCKKLGYDLFQGYFFAKPKIVEGRALPPSRLSVLELLNKLYDPNASLIELSQIIAKDVALSEKLMKFISPLMPQGVEVGSVYDAVMRFGLARLQSWGSMLALTALEDKPPELFKTALIRAKFCEILGSKLGQPAKEIFYTVGLFSALDAMMDFPMEQLLEKMNLSQEVKSALLYREGILGQVLGLVLSLEKDVVPQQLPPKIQPEDVSKSLLQAMKEVQQMDFIK